MIDRVLPCVLHYANAAVSFVPDYGKKHACLFAASLLAETGLRFGFLKRWSIFSIKGPQIISCLLAIPAFNSSYKVSIPTVVSTLTLFTSWFSNKVANLSETEIFSVGKDKVAMVSLEADRPPLISLYDSAMEVANIASKIINSLAVGLVAQKALTGQTEGKIRVVVSAALMGLSALNIYFRQGTNPA